MQKSFGTVLLIVLVVLVFGSVADPYGISGASAQTKKKTVIKQEIPSGDDRPVASIPKEPTLVSIDAHPPALATSVTELKFGSQGIGVESCLQITINNVSNSAQTLTQLSTDDQKRYSIPSPSHEMLPISIQPKSMLTISVCFKPEKTVEYKTRLVIKTPTDSIVIPTSGKGIRPEDVGKQPKNDFTVIPVKKKKNNWALRLELIRQCKITMQLFDELGVMRVTFWNGAFKNEGVYETPFDGTDKSKMKLPSGKYYVRCQIEDAAHANQVTKFTKEITIK